MGERIRVRRVLVALGLVSLVGGAGVWFSGVIPISRARPPQNSVLVIAPYNYNGTWVFDDARFGLVREPFLAGVPEMIDVLVADVPQAEEGFRLTFSAKPFPDFQQKLTWVRGDMDGNYYKIDDPPLEGWICPALFKYYESAPPELYVRADPLATG